MHICLLSHLGAPIYTGGDIKELTSTCAAYLSKIQILPVLSVLIIGNYYTYIQSRHHTNSEICMGRVHAPSRPVQVQYGILIGIQVQHMLLCLTQKSIVAVKKVVNKPKCKICFVHHSYRSRCGLVPRMRHGFAHGFGAENYDTARLF